MGKRDRIEVLREKVRQLWRIAAQDARGDNVIAVAAVYHDIGKLLDEESKSGLTLLEVFENERKRDACKKQQAAEVHGDLRPCAGEGEGEVPACGCGKGVLEEAEGRVSQAANGSAP